MTSQPLLTGKWDNSQIWQMIQSNKLPDAALCTAVYCLAIIPATEQIVLTRNYRGWEMLGGHIELAETVEQALLRECMEEGGFVPEQHQLFGFRKITAKQPVPHAQRSGSLYPFPHGYIPHFIATSALPLQKPSGEEILERRTFSFDKVENLNLEQWPILKLLLDYYKNHRLGATIP